MILYFFMPPHTKICFEKYIVEIVWNYVKDWDCITEAFPVLILNVLETK